MGPGDWGMGKEITEINLLYHLLPKDWDGELATIRVFRTQKENLRVFYHLITKNECWKRTYYRRNDMGMSVFLIKGRYFVLALSNKEMENKWVGRIYNLLYSSGGYGLTSFLPFTQNQIMHLIKMRWVVTPVPHAHKDPHLQH